MSGKYALVIGNSEYEDANLARLTAPSADVNDLAALLRAPDIGGFSEVTALVNELSSTIRRAIARFFALKTFESSRPRMGRARSRMTAAATTGPASGPRPASSQPATGKMPLLRARRSRRKVGRRIGSLSGRRKLGLVFLPIAAMSARQPLQVNRETLRL